MLQLAGAIARRHPKLLKGIHEANVSAGAGKLIERWAETLSDDLQLAFHDGYNQGDALGLWTAGRSEVFLQPAFERLQATVPGAGLDLFQCLDSMSGWNLLMTPRELYGRLGYSMWYDEYDEQKFREAVVDNDGEWDESMRGPDAFRDDLPGIPHEALDFTKKPRYKPRFQATRYAQLAREQQDPWVAKLMVAMSDCFRFAAARHKRVWDLPRDGEWEPAVFTYYARWSRDDDMGRWVDDAMQHLWDSGEGTDATLIFRPRDVSHRMQDQMKTWDELVSCIEGCSRHVSVVDQLFAVLGEGDEDED